MSLSSSLKYTASAAAWSHYCLCFSDCLPTLKT